MNREKMSRWLDESPYCRTNALWRKKTKRSVYSLLIKVYDQINFKFSLACISSEKFISWIFFPYLASFCAMLSLLHVGYSLRAIFGQVNKYLGNFVFAPPNCIVSFGYASASQAGMWKRLFSNRFHLHRFRFHHFYQNLS